nr:copia protein [Tanacetum cinerariifolium]
MILRDRDKRLTLNMKHDTASYSNHPQRESVNLINIFNVSSEDFLEVLVSNQTSGNPTFSLHQELTSPEVTCDTYDSKGCNDIHPYFTDDPLSGSTTYSSNSLLEEFTDELTLITYPLDYDDNLQFDIEFDLKEIEFLLYQGKDSNLKDSIDQTDLANLDDYFVDPTPEMFTDEHTPDYSSPPIFDVYDDDFLEVESDADNVYNDPFDSKGEKIKESKLLIDELDLPCDFLPYSEYDSFDSQDFSRVDALSSTNNEDKVINPGILIHEKPVKIVNRVVQDKKPAISNAFLVLEDFDPPFYEPLVFKDVPKSKMLLLFSSENEKKVFKPGIYTSKKVHSCFLPELSHPGYHVFNVNQNFISLMKIFLVQCGKNTHLLDVLLRESVAFRKSTCFVRNEDGVDLLTGDRSSNLYTISLNEVASNSSTCLLAKVSSSQSWLWHQLLSHLDFATINNLVKNNLVQGLPKMKFEKDHLCSACEQGKIHRNHNKSKMAFASNKPLYLLHMDLCGPMRIESINGKRYVLVVIDDYSRYTWVFFLRSKDEASEVIISFNKKTQVNLQLQVQCVRTDNGTEFKNKTLAKFFDEVVDSNNMILNVDEASTSHNLFNQPYPHEKKWTKDHPLYKIIGDPKSSVGTRVPRPEGKSVIKTKWIFKNKKDKSSWVIRNKERLVAVGYSQQECIDYDETFAPVARIEAIRLFLAYAAHKDFTVFQMDLKTAFLNRILIEEVYVGQPLCFFSKQYPDHVYALDKALYGLKQAHRAWYDVLSQFLIDSGFQKVHTPMVEQAKLKLDLVGKPVDHTDYR